MIGQARALVDSWYCWYLAGTYLSDSLLVAGGTWLVPICLTACRYLVVPGWYLSVWQPGGTWWYLAGTYLSDNLPVPGGTWMLVDWYIAGTWLEACWYLIST